MSSTLSFVQRSVYRPLPYPSVETVTVEGIGLGSQKVVAKPLFLPPRKLKSIQNIY